MSGNDNFILIVSLQLLLAIVSSTIIASNPMPFKKLNAHIKEKLADQEITAPTPFQMKSIPIIKSGANIYCTAPEGSGKTTTIILTTLQKLKCEEVGDAPRAIVLVGSRESAIELYDAFVKFSRQSSLRIYFGDEKLHIDVLKSEIFEGVDILISTAKPLQKLFASNGVNRSQLKIFSVDDAEFLVQNAPYTAIMSMTQSIHKCQFVLYSEKIHPTLKRFESYFMKHAKIVAI